MKLFCYCVTLNNNIIAKYKSRNLLFSGRTIYHRFQSPFFCGQFCFCFEYFQNQIKNHLKVLYTLSILKPKQYTFYTVIMNESFSKSGHYTPTRITTLLSRFKQSRVSRPPKKDIYQSFPFFRFLNLSFCFLNRNSWNFNIQSFVLISQNIRNLLFSSFKPVRFSLVFSQNFSSLLTFQTPTFCVVLRFNVIILYPLGRIPQPGFKSRQVLKIP